MKGRAFPWTAEEIALVKQNGSKNRAEIRSLLCKRFGAKTYYTVLSISGLCKRNGWKAADNGCFKPGNIPHPNAGAKGPTKTSFKPGNAAPNKRPIGSTRVTRDGFTEIKIADPNIWDHAQRVLWREHFGDIPDGYVVAFKDGNKRNISIDNLELVSRAQLIRENKLKSELSCTHHGITPAIRALAKLRCEMIKQQKTAHSRQTPAHDHLSTPSPP